MMEIKLEMALKMMYLEKIRKMKIWITIAIMAIVPSIYIISVFGIKPESIAAIATIFLVLANFQLVKITKNQDKPYLHFYAETDGSIYIKNVGKGVALNVEYTYIKNGRPGDSKTLDALSPQEEFELDIRYPVLDDERNYMLLTISATCNDINNEPHIRSSIIPIQNNKTNYI